MRFAEDAALEVENNLQRRRREQGREEEGIKKQSYLETKAAGTREVTHPEATGGQARSKSRSKPTTCRKLKRICVHQEHHWDGRCS